MNNPLVIWEGKVPVEMRDPILVYSFDGWIDAGFGAATAVGNLKLQIRTQRLVSFDVDELIDMRARRPVMRLVNGVNTSMRWPRLQLRYGRDSAGQHMLVLTGPEPDFKWHAFCSALLELVEHFGVRRCIGFGAFPAPVPHTRPVTLGSTATTEELAGIVGFIDATMDIPAGVSAAFERALAESGHEAVGIWARVPHYVASMPYPAAATALLECLARLTGLIVDTTELRAAADKTREQIDGLIANNPEHRHMVEQLEAQIDGEFGWGRGAGAMDPNSFPTGDELAAELERYLRGESGTAS